MTRKGEHTAVEGYARVASRKSKVARKKSIENCR